MPGRVRGLLAGLYAAVAHKRWADWKVVLMCLAISSTFWLFSALNKTYDSTLQAPLRLQLGKPGMANLLPTPGSLRVQVRATGWQLAAHTYLTQAQPLVLAAGNSVGSATLGQQDMRQQIASQWEGMEIVSTQPQQLSLRLDQITSRKLTVQLNPASLQLAPACSLLGPITISPDTLVLTGPASVLDTIPGQVLLSITRANISGDYSEEVRLPIQRLPFVMYSTDKFKVSLAVSSLPVGRASLPVRLLGFPPEKVSQYADSLVDLYYSLPETVPAPSPDSFALAAYWAELRPGDSLVPIRIERIPAYLRKPVLQRAYIYAGH